MKTSPHSKPPRLRSDTLLSVGLHLAVWTVLIIIFAPQVAPWARSLLATGKTKLPDKAPQAHQENIATMKESLAASMVEGQLSQAVAGELTQKDEQKLLEATHGDLAKSAEKLDESAAPDADMSKLSDDLKKEAYADLEAELKNMASEAMKDEVDTQLDTSIYPQVKNKVESGAIGQMSHELADKIRERLAQERQARADKAVAELEQVKKQLTTARDTTEQAANNARNSQFDSAAATEKQSSDLSTAADKAATDSLADVVKSFPQTAGPANQAAGAFQSDTQQAFQNAAQAISAQKKDDATAQLQKAHESLDRQITALNQMQDQVRQAAGNNDPTSRALLAGSMTDLQNEVSSELQKQSLDDVGNKIADRLTQALQGEAAKLNMTPDQLRALIKAEVKARLAADFKDHPPQVDAALSQTRADNQLQTPEELEKARAAADAALAAVDPALLASMKTQLQTDVSQIAANHIPGILASAGDVEASDDQSTDLRMEAIASLQGKVGQMETNMEAGRPGLGLEGEGLGMGEGPGGMGLGLPGQGMSGGSSQMGFINAEAMEKFGKDLRDRSNPDNFYKPVTETDDIASVAHPIDSTDLPAEVYFDPQTQAPAQPADPAAATAPAPERQIPQPTFKTVAFGAASMMVNPITIDGDLSDWGELKHPIPTRFHSDGSPVTDPTNVYVRWSPDGLYIAYTTKKQGPIIHDAHQGDCLEVWIDGQNVRSKQMQDSQTSQQLFLAPFGYKGDPTPAIVEVGRGNRGLKMFASYVDRTGVMGKVASKMTADGYTVEAFISRKAIAYPNLIPGAYLAFNFSVNRGVTDADAEQWSAPKSQVTWDKPDTWGDLLLLGTDATAKFISYDDPSQPAKPLVPGQPIAFEIQDKDMDLNPNKKDRIPAVLRLQGAEDGLFVVLEETTDDSGIFRGSVNTQPYGAPPKADTLNIRGGESVELVYHDLRTEYGETNRIVTATLPVGTPVLKLAGRL